MFEQLIYVSTRPDGAGASDLTDILRASRRNNPDIDVTGLLIVTPRRYVQALEGPPESIEPLLDFIARDPRHGGMQVIARLTAPRRSFASFAMAHAESDETFAEAIEERLGRHDAAGDAEIARDLLHDLARRAVAAPDQPA